jgi:hypothetical protein
MLLGTISSGMHASLVEKVLKEMVLVLTNSCQDVRLSMSHCGEVWIINPALSTRTHKLESCYVESFDPKACVLGHSHFSFFSVCVCVCLCGVGGGLGLGLETQPHLHKEMSVIKYHEIIFEQ